MRMRLLAVLATVAVPAAAAAPPHRAARHAAVDWTRTAVQTPDGGIRIGNPAARARLVEYGSFTCPHCAAFAKDGFAALAARYVRSGRLSFEFRPALRDGVDMMAATAAWCGGPQRFFPVAEALYAAQDRWLDAVGQYAQTHGGDLSGDGALAALAQAAGLTALAEAKGVPAARTQACLGDRVLQQRLAKTAGDAWDVRRIGGTPAFYLNDEKLDGVYGWAALEPRLKAAVAG